MEIGPPEIPPIVDKYRLLAELGHGGMARVFLAVAHGPSGFSKLVVLKALRMHLVEDQDAVQMFLDEARLAGRLNHPNVVHTHEVVEHAGQYMMVMEYLDGQSLAGVLKRSRVDKVGVPLAYQLRAVLDCLQGLHYAHTLKDFDGTPLALVHRDVSPQNIFITYDGQIKVLDFGIAKALTSSAETKAGVIKGKVAYMAPEQLLSEPIDQRVDVFGVGAMLWHVATGQRLWRGEPEVQVIGRLMRGEIPLPRSVRADVHPELERITMKALAVERADRYGDAMELHDDLERFVESTGAKATAREVGAFVANMFEDVRAQIARTIETQLSKASALDPSAFERGRIPTIFSSSGTITTPMGSGALKTEPPGPHSACGEDAFTPSTQSNVGARANSIPGDAARRRNKRAWFPLVAVFGVIAGLAAALFLVSPVRSVLVGSAEAPAVATTATSSPTPVETTQPASSAPQESPALVDITVEAKPALATLRFDGVELEGNPATKRVPKDGATHKVRVEARGYEPQELEVVADKDLGVSIALDRATAGGERLAAAVSPPKSPPAAAATSGSPAAPPPTATAKPKEPSGGTGGAPNARDRIKNLDKSNPWEQ